MCTVYHFATDQRGLSLTKFRRAGLAARYSVSGHHAFGANVFLFLSSLPLLPPPSHHGIVWLLYLSSLYSNLHCIAGPGLPIHRIGEVSWDSKRRRARGLLLKSLTCRKCRSLTCLACILDSDFI
jgi:hypothetical protein